MERNRSFNRRDFLRWVASAAPGNIAIVWDARFGFFSVANGVMIRESSGYGVYVARDLQEQWVQRQEYDT